MSCLPCKMRVGTCISPSLELQSWCCDAPSCRTKVVVRLRLFPSSLTLFSLLTSLNRSGKVLLLGLAVVETVTRPLTISGCCKASAIAMRLPLEKTQYIGPFDANPFHERCGVFCHHLDCIWGTRFVCAPHSTIVKRQHLELRGKLVDDPRIDSQISPQPCYECEGFALALHLIIDSYVIDSDCEHGKASHDHGRNNKCVTSRKGKLRTHRTNRTGDFWLKIRKIRKVERGLWDRQRSD